MIYFNSPICDDRSLSGSPSIQNHGYEIKNMVNKIQLHDHLRHHHGPYHQNHQNQQNQQNQRNQLVYHSKNQHLNQPNYQH